MTALEPKRIRLDLVGERRFYQQDVLVPFIRRLQAHPLLAAETWGLDDRSSHPYDEERITRIASGKPSPYVLQLKRARRIKQTTVIRLNDRPGAGVEAPSKTSPKS